MLYQYYNSLQICFFANDIKKQADIIAEFIKQKNYEMVSGRADIITCIAPKLPMYISSFGEILSKSPKIENRSYDIKAEIATAEDCNEIAQLICSDQNIGGHYTVENLEKQLRNRMHRWDCINMIIRMEGKIVSHMATYANCDEFAVLGGLVTERTHRGKGYGRQIISELTQKVTRDGKRPILYCYDKNTIRWYNSMNWKTVMHCGKLEKRR